MDVAKIATLARLALSEQEMAQLSNELDAIVHYVELLSEVDIEGIEPTAHATLVTNVVRPDTPGTCMDQEHMLANAPAVLDGELVRVPVVIADDGGA